jgi:prepilin-type N-terminal cleavage/methylation domain-containing protein
MSKSSGFTLLEVLISLGLLGLLTVYLFQSIGSTTQVSAAANSANDLIREGQIAQQVMVSRIKEACHVYPTATTFSMGSDFTTRNAANTPDDEWRVGTDPVIAMILPPAGGGGYRFFAYYAIPRSQYVASAAPDINPGGDALNDATVWMLMEYRRTIPTMPDGTLCSAMPTQTGYDIDGDTGRLLVDYLSPDGAMELFNVGATRTDGSAALVGYNLRLQRENRGGSLTQVGGGASGTNLSGNVYPVNLGL